MELAWHSGCVIYGLPRDNPGFDSPWGRCNHQALYKVYVLGVFKY